MAAKDTNIVNEQQKILGFRVQASVSGLPIPIGWGRNRVPGNLIWFGDFTPIEHRSTTSSGGKGGGGETSVTNITYTYRAALAILLGEGPIATAGTAWRGKEKLTGLMHNVATEEFTVPGSPYQVTVTNSGAFVASVAVFGKIGQFFGNPISIPLTEGVHYTRSGGTYTFGASFEGIEVRIQYTYTQQSFPSGLTQLGFSLFTGTYSQSPWSYLSTNHPSQALSYRGIAYVASESYDLGSQAALPNHNFEVDWGFGYGDGVLDAEPGVILHDFLTNEHYGVDPNFPIGDWTDWSAYCVANNLFLSPLILGQRPAADFVKHIAAITNAGLVDSEGVLKIVPYSDEEATAHGVTYTPNSTPLYSLDDDDFLHDEGEDPIKVIRSNQSDAFNQVQVIINNRDNDYNAEPVEAKDQANIDDFGLRAENPLNAPEIQSVAVGRLVSQHILQRRLYIRERYEFRLPWHYALLEPMDPVSITDEGLGLDDARVRVLEIEELDDGSFRILAEEFPSEVSQPAVYESEEVGGYNADYNVAPGNVNVPAIIDAPGVLTVSGYELWAAISGNDANWGGAGVWISFDGESYKRVGRTTGRARHGTISANFPAGNDPDTVNACSANLSISRGELLSGTQNDADQGSTLCYVGGELISYEEATLVDVNQYDLETYLRRGLHGTVNGNHTVGETFIRLDDGLFRFEYDPALVGSTIHLKFTSFNVYGVAEQTLDEVQEYTYVIQGSISRPSNVSGFTVSQNGQVAVFQWNLVQQPNIKGYEIRYIPQEDNPDETDWANARPLTRVTRGTQITTAKLPPGTWTCGIKAVDNSEKESVLTSWFDIEMFSTFDLVSAIESAPDWLHELPYLELPGVNGNFASTPHRAGHTIPGDLDVRAQIAMNWSDANFRCFISKWDAPSGNASWVFERTNDKKLKIHLSSNGSTGAGNTPTSTATFEPADGTVSWVRSTVVVNNGANERETRFYTSPNGEEWEQLGDAIVQSGAITLFESTTPLQIGKFGVGSGGDLLPGKVYYAEVRSGIDGNVVAVFDARNIVPGETTGKSAAGDTWTLQGANSRIVAGGNGSITNFRIHPSGVLVPESTKMARELTNEELFEQFVPYPQAVCTYESPEVDLTIDGEVRIWNEQAVSLGRGHTGIADLLFEIDFKLSAGSYDGFEPWTIGSVDARFVKSKITLTTGDGVCFVSGFKPVVDAEERTEEAFVTLAPGGSAVVFDSPFRLVPSVELFNEEESTPLVPVTANITTSGFTGHLFNTSNSDVGGDARYVAKGV